MEGEARMAKEKGLRLEATQAQQTKLIDFLQTKVTNYEGKKKTFADKIFGNKENRPMGGQHVPVAYADLEGMLEREKSKTKKLVSQLDRARAEVVALKSSNDPVSLPRKVLEQLDTSAGTTSHNIPHRLVTITNRKSVKCAVCGDSVSLLTAAMNCRECGITIHTSCAPALPNNCGLSSQLASLKTGSTVPSTPISNRPLPPAPSNDTKDTLKEGRVQCLISGQWSEVFLVLKSSGTLDVFSGSGQDLSHKLEQVGLTLTHCYVSLQSSVSFSEVYHINTTDRPYTFKLTLHTMGKLEKAMYFMCNNFSSKVSGHLEQYKFHFFPDFVHFWVSEGRSDQIWKIPDFF